MTIAIAALLDSAQRQLTSVSDTPRLDAEILLAHMLEKPRSYLYAWPERCVESAIALRFEELVARREEGEPVAYITGEREFWSLSLAIAPGVLIPRPETELLVELALARLPLKQRAAVVDLGTGSGAIALAIAHERPHARVIATDISGAALTQAVANARRLGIENLEFRVGDWCVPLGEECFDLIVANPPYIARGDSHLMQGDLQFEPLGALVAGVDGLDAIRLIVAQARSHLYADGWLLLEHGYNQGDVVPTLLCAQGYQAVELYFDAAGIGRASGGRRG